MATTPPLRLGVIEPKDAIAAFEQRKLLLPSFRWQDVWQEEHQRGFAVAGVMREDVLKIFRDGLDAKFATGGSLHEFKKAIKPALAAKGFWGDVEVTDPQTGETRVTRFDDRRLALIYDVNVRQSYAAGQWKAFQLSKKQQPFIIYRTMEDAFVRPEHAAWDGVLLPIDHPFWQTHWPPCGWRCRCNVTAVSQRIIDRMRDQGRVLKTEAPPEEFVPYVNPYTGEVKAVPKGVDPGFGNNPGVDNVTRDASLSDYVLQKVGRSDAYSAAVQAAQATTDMPALLVRRTDEFGKWVDDVRALARPSGNTFTLGVVRPEVVRALEAAETPLESAVLAVRDLDVDHTLRDAVSRGVAREAIPLALYKQLPMLLSRPSAVLQVVGDDGAIVYVVDVTDADGKLLKLFVRVGFEVKQLVDGQRVRKTLNLVRTASLQAPDALLDANSFRVVWGRWPP